MPRRGQACLTRTPKNKPVAARAHAGEACLAPTGHIHPQGSGMPDPHTQGTTRPPVARPQVTPTRRGQACLTRAPKNKPVAARAAAGHIHPQGSGMPDPRTQEQAGCRSRARGRGVPRPYRAHPPAGVRHARPAHPGNHPAAARAAAGHIHPQGSGMPDPRPQEQAGCRSRGRGAHPPVGVRHA